MRFGCGRTRTPVVVEAVAVVVDASPFQRLPHHGRASRRSIAARSLALDAERLLLHRSARRARTPAAAGRRTSSPASPAPWPARSGCGPGRTITLIPNFSRRRAPGAVRHRDERVGRLAGDPLRQPQASRSRAARACRRTRRTSASLQRSSACRGRNRCAPSSPQRTARGASLRRARQRTCAGAALHAAGLAPAEREPDDDDRDQDRRLGHVAERSTRRSRPRPRRPTRRPPSRSRHAGARRVEAEFHVGRSYTSGARSQQVARETSLRACCHRNRRDRHTVA